MQSPKSRRVAACAPCDIAQLFARRFISLRATAAAALKPDQELATKAANIEAHNYSLAQLSELLDTDLQRGLKDAEARRKLARDGAQSFVPHFDCSEHGDSNARLPHSHTSFMSPPPIPGRNELTPPPATPWYFKPPPHNPPSPNPSALFV
jgi:hypothetical protein